MKLSDWRLGTSWCAVHLTARVIRMVRHTDNAWDHMTTSYNFTNLWHGLRLVMNNRVSMVICDREQKPQGYTSTTLMLLKRKTNNPQLWRKAQHWDSSQNLTSRYWHSKKMKIRDVPMMIHHLSSKQAKDEWVITNSWYNHTINQCRWV